MKILNVKVNKFKHLNNLNLIFEPSLNPNIYPIVGNNGCGKSTLLKLIYCLFKHKENEWLIKPLLKLGDFNIASIKILIDDDEIDFFFIWQNNKIEFFTDNSSNKNLLRLTVAKQLFFIEDRKVYNNELFESFDNLINYYKSKVDSELSFGELKLLILQNWFLERNIQNSIVLIDEIENSLSSDNQFNIVNLLEQFGNNNQFLLATHSFSLCEALTPSHIKFIEK